MTAQELFTAAREVYAKDVKRITTLQKTYFAAAEADFSAEEALKAYDLILQAVMANAALADGLFDTVELQFTEKLPDSADLVAYVNEHYDLPTPLTWQMMADQKDETVKLFAANLPEVLDTVCTGFAAPLAVIDKALEDVDLLQIFCSDICKIVYYLSKVDGHSDEEEAVAAARSVNKLITFRWKKFMKQS